MTHSLHTSAHETLPSDFLFFKKHVILEFNLLLVYFLKDGESTRPLEKNFCFSAKCRIGKWGHGLRAVLHFTVFSECQLEQKNIKMGWDWNKVNTFERFRLSLSHLWILHWSNNNPTFHPWLSFWFILFFPVWLVTEWLAYCLIYKWI